MKTLSIIGCGRVGQTLATLWHRAEVFSIASIVTSSITSAECAVKTIGAGQAVAGVHAIESSDVFLIASPDDSIEKISGLLAESGLLCSESIVFHVSGALSSDVLAGPASCGAQIASVHPVKSFAQVSEAVRTFNGTYCGIEGMSDAISVLQPAFEQIGAQTFSITKEFKLSYHSALVLSCNYMVALIDAALDGFKDAGIDSALALEVVAPLMRETLEHVLLDGVDRSLTGPIARGDVELVSKQIKDLNARDQARAAIYTALGRQALTIAERSGTLDEQKLSRLKELFAL